MEKIVRWFGLVLTFIWIGYGTALAAPANLLGMTAAHREDLSRISFVFDRIPEFEVNPSGQRVQVILLQTGFADSFQKRSVSQSLAPLVRVQTRKDPAKSVVELYFHDIPEFVDVAVDRRTASFTVNVFWDGKRAGSRPAILDRSMGRLTPIRDGVAAEKVIASDYAGRWIEFFKEFEWSPSIDIPIRFSFPTRFSPMVRQNASYFSGKLREPIQSAQWDRVAAQIPGLLESGLGGQQADFYRLLLAECLLRQEKTERAQKVLGRIALVAVDERIRAWETYYQAYAMAAAHKPYQAARLLAQEEAAALEEKGPGPWFSILAAEIALATNNPEKALDHLEVDPGGQEECLRISVLRRADAEIKRGRADKAVSLYEQAASDLHFLRRHPASLANWATLLYRHQQAHERAYRYFYLLSETIAEKLPAQKQIVDYWSAMARLRAGERRRARLMLWEIDEHAAGTEAGFRAWLKLMDLDVADHPEADFGSLIPEYREVIERADVRQVREEAFFKQILAAHLAGDDLSAVKLLGRFFDDYWAGALQPEARALFVEIFPGVVRSQVKKEAFFETLALVAKHRDLLAQARITYDFLHDLAQSYTQAGFLEQAAATYLYLLDFEETPQKREKIFRPLIRIYQQQNAYARVRQYAAAYLRKYPKGADRARVLFFYANALMETGAFEEAVALLHEKKRPNTPQLDYLAGKLFFELGRYELAERYLARAAGTADPDRAGEIRFKRAEALFFMKAWDRAVPLYEKLLSGIPFQGPAGFRLVQIRVDQGQHKRALKLYRQMTEMEIEEHWLELAGGTVETVHLNNQGE